MDGLLQVPMSFCLSIGAVVACGIVMAYLLRRQLCTPECQSASLQVLEWQPATPCSVWHIAIAYLMQWRTATIRNLTSIDLDVSAVDNV
ncbi:hypothetical protein AcW1_007120 [Taiwanofungus camphoratus]|nr:hypothetical protein AcW1_007120 [Antrodia cinnamomea]